MAIISILQSHFQNFQQHCLNKYKTKKRRQDLSSFLVENYLEQLFVSDFEALLPHDLASLALSTFFADLALFADLFILEFLPNIVFTSCLFKDKLLVKLVCPHCKEIILRLRFCRKIFCVLQTNQTKRTPMCPF